MKKLIFLISLLLLAACGSSELEEFSQGYNERAVNDGIEELNSEKFGDIETEDVGDRGWQSLYESRGYYIDAKYEDGDNLSGYHLVIDESEPFEEYEGDGYRAGVTIAKTLGLNAGDYAGAFSTAIRDGSYNYTENGYRIDLTYPGEDGLTSVGMIVNFDKN